MTRISTSEIFRQASSAMFDQQTRMLETQQQLASGKRIQSPSDDPTDAVRALDLTGAIESTRQFTRNGDLATARLQREESALAAVTENLQRVRELTVQAANAPQTDATRGDIAAEIEQRRDELIDLANTRDANGEYLFAGFSSSTKPFAETPSGVRYDGDQGQRSLAVSADRKVAVGDSGFATFMDLPDGNGTFTVAADAGNSGGAAIETGSVVDSGSYTPDDYTIEFTADDTFEVRDGAGTAIASGVAYESDTTIDAIPGIEVVIEGPAAAGDEFRVSPAGRQDMFTTYDNLIGALRTPAETTAGGGQLQTSINQALTELDTALGQTQDVRAQVGARLESVESHKNINEKLALDLESVRSGVEDIDVAATISRYQQQLTSFQAAQQSFARIQNLSLFQFIG